MPYKIPSLEVISAEIKGNTVETGEVFKGVMKR